MTITLTPKDIIERCLWSDYEQYILRGKTQAEKDEIIRLNESFDIAEADAYVIRLIRGLLTDNLRHKLNEYLLNVVELDGLLDDANRKMIGVDALHNGIARFKKLFPAAYQPDLRWAESMAEMLEYAEQLRERIATLPTAPVKAKQMPGMPPREVQCVNVTTFKKVLSKHHG